MPPELQVVVAFVQPFQLDAVVDALRSLPCFPGMSVSEVRGFGAHRAHPPAEGEETVVHALEKNVRIEV
jgi:nitrogen regulatory protein PII